MPPLALEEFDAFAAEHGAALPETIKRTVAEAERVAAYEQGYKAGWDDAAEAESKDQMRIGADFARTLQELSFTFHEARAHVIKSMEPLLREVVDTLLPKLVSETLCQTILEELRPMIAEGGDGPVEILVSPGSRPALEGLMAGFDTIAVRLTEETSLADGQAYLRLGHIERQVDLTGAMARITEAVHALYAINERTLKHG